jgi:hypothetical protein
LAKSLSITGRLFPQLQVPLFKVLVTFSAFFGNKNIAKSHYFPVYIFLLIFQTFCQILYLILASSFRIVVVGFRGFLSLLFRNPGNTVFLRLWVGANEGFSRLSNIFFYHVIYVYITGYLLAIPEKCNWPLSDETKNNVLLLKTHQIHIKIRLNFKLEPVG